MQYNVHINQLLIHTYYPSLDFDDGALLYFMKQFIPEDSIEMFEKDGKKWYWFAHRKIFLEMPMLKIKTKAGIINRFNKLIQLKIIERCIQSNKTYYSFTDNFFKLFRGDSKVTKKFETKSQEKGSLSSNEILDNHNTKSLDQNQNINIKDTFEKFFKEYPLGYEDNKAEAYQIFLSNGLTNKIEDILKALANYKKLKKVEEGFIFSPSKFLSEKYISYVEGIPKGSKTIDINKKKVEKRAQLIIKKLDMLAPEFDKFDYMEQNKVYESNGSTLKVDGKIFFNDLECKAIVRIGGLEYLLYSYSVKSVQEKLERILDEL